MTGTTLTTTHTTKANESVCVSTAAEEDQWQTVARTDHGPMREYSVSYQNLMPSSSYIFRVTAYNRFGISYPVSTQEPVGRFRPLLRRCFAFLTVVGSPVGAVPDAEQVVLGVQLSAPEALLPPDVVPGDAGRRFRRHHHPPRRRPLRQEQELQIQTSVTVFFLPSYTDRFLDLHLVFKHGGPDLGGNASG